MDELCAQRVPRGSSNHLVALERHRCVCGRVSRRIGRRHALRARALPRHRPKFVQAFVQRARARVVAEHVKEDVRLEESLVQDLGSLIIAKTGANAALFPVFGSSVGEPRLTILPETILISLKERMASEGAPPDIQEIWPAAA